MREAIKLVATLGLVAAISGGVLGVFYHYTMPIVEARQMVDMVEKGFKGVLPEAHDFAPIEEGEMPAGVTQVYEGLDEQGDRMGIVFEAVGDGYVGPITVAVGVDVATETVVGVKVLSQTESPGMGEKIEEDEFLDQFQGKSLGDPFAVGQDVDGITGSTVSAKAVADLVGDKARLVLECTGQ